MTPAGSKGAAFFDVDKTLLPDTSMEMLLATALLRGELDGRFAVFPFIAEWFRLLRRGPTAARKANKAYLRGARPEDVRSWAEEIFAREVSPVLGDRGHRWISRERDRGRVIVLMTGMPDLLLGPLIRTFSPDAAVATVLMVGENGRLTGRRASFHVYGIAKRFLARQLAKDHGLDLALSSAYGDHSSDVYLLESVGKPYAVDPDRRLRRIAVARGWRILQGSGDDI